MSNILKVFAHACFQTRVQSFFGYVWSGGMHHDFGNLARCVSFSSLFESFFLFCTLLVGSKVCFGLEKHSGVVVHVQAVLIV